MYNFFKSVSFISICFFLFAHDCLAEEFIVPSRKDKCSVCGMFVYKYGNWTSEIVFKDGTYAVFESPKEMFMYYFDISRYNKGKTRDDIAAIFVTEYYTTTVMNAKDVLFVSGSDVHGPMGEELVPVDGKERAFVFRSDHGGARILKFKDITPDFFEE